MRRYKELALACCFATFSYPLLAQERYTIPDSLTDLKTWRNGYSAEEATNFREEFDASSLTEAGDVGAFAMANLSDVLRTAQLYRNGDVIDFSRNPMPEIADVSLSTALGTQTLRETLDDPRARIRAFAVVHKGELVFEEYIGIRPWDNHLWASASKSITGLIIASLEEEGLVDLNEPIATYLPDFAGTAWADIKLADVVHQRSGLDIEESSFAKPDHPMAAFYATAFGAEGAADNPLREILKTVEVKDPPGTQFIYSSMNTQMASLVIEALTGKAWNDAATERLWQRVGMEGDAQVALTLSGEPVAYGLIASRLRDMARYATLYTPSWERVAIERVVPEGYLDRLYEAADPAIFRGGYMAERLVESFGTEEIGAAYQWDAVLADGDFYKSGRSGQFLYISPGTDTAVVAFSTVYRSEIWLEGYAREIVTSVFRQK
ncbi:serine hydrolase domain-containing protein [Labrenzia sp. DG1229]|uniref:serine hydrolase domain-containing protein n=1 Tax=Labrenzia sp. DG1229 TaxID=681847 RepID=UPI00048EAD82|nr:serine hydrolase domain-containing protein [Labrenzia sp. DG1229]